MTLKQLANAMDMPLNETIMDYAINELRAINGKYTVLDLKINSRAQRILEIAKAMINTNYDWEVRNHLEGISLHWEGYAEPGYSNPNCGIIATGNWNDVSHCSNQFKTLISRIGSLFEKMGIECEWSDEWSECSDCYKLIRTNPDSYFWSPSFLLDHNNEICIECIQEDPELFLAKFEGNDQSLWPISSIDPGDYGYIKVNKNSYEIGHHPGQSDDPEKLAKELRKKDIHNFIFVLDEAGQFDTRFSIYYK